MEASIHSLLTLHPGIMSIRNNRPFVLSHPLHALLAQAKLDLLAVHDMLLAREDEECARRRRRPSLKDIGKFWDERLSDDLVRAVQEEVGARVIG